MEVKNTVLQTWIQISNILSRLGIFQAAIKNAFLSRRQNGKKAGKMMTKLKLSRVRLVSFKQCGGFSVQSRSPHLIFLERLKSKNGVTNLLPKPLHFESDWDIFCCLWHSWVLTQFLSIFRCTVGRFTHLTRYKESI